MQQIIIIDALILFKFAYIHSIDTIRFLTYVSKYSRILTNHSFVTRFDR